MSINKIASNTWKSFLKSQNIFVCNVKLYTYVIFFMKYPFHNKNVRPYWSIFFGSENRSLNSGGGPLNISVTLWMTNSLHLDHQNKAFRHSLKALVTTVWRLSCKHVIGKAGDILLRTYKGIAKQFCLVCEREREKMLGLILTKLCTWVFCFWASNLGRVRYAS